MKNELNKCALPKYAGNYSGAKLWNKLAAVKLAYDTVKASITPEIEKKAKEKLAQWLGEKEED